MIFLIRSLYFKAIRMAWKPLLVALLFIITISTIVLPIIEPQTFKTHMDSLWYTMTALPTIGYGDLSPHTTAGRLFAIIFVHIIGLMVFSALIGKLLEGVVSYQRRRESGDIVFTNKNHYVIVDWSHKAENAVKEIHKKNRKAEIVVIDTRETFRHENPYISYVRGFASNKDVLERANIKDARAVLIFADERIDDQLLRDGKSLMIASAIERISKDIHTTVEIEREEHIESFQHINIDRFIVANQTIAKLIVDEIG